MFKRLILQSFLLFFTASYSDAEDINDLLLGEARAILTQQEQSKSQDQLLLQNQPVNEKSASQPSTQSALELGYNHYTNNNSKSNYFVEAGKYYNVAPWLLWAMGKVESGHNPYAINKNKNGTYDIGMMQINSIHLKRLSKYGIKEKDLYDTRTNIYVGAYILKECINKYGNNWNSVSCYNGMSKENRLYFTYAKKVHKALNDGIKMAQR